MQTQQLIRSSAEVVTITSFKPGDVYKRVESSSYGGDASLRFGVVEDVMNNGEDSAVTAFEYRPDYTSGVVAELKVWDGGKPAALYPATPDEVLDHLDGLAKAAEEKALAAREALEKAESVVRLVQRVDQQVATRRLTIPETATAPVEDVSAELERLRAIERDWLAASPEHPESPDTD